MDDEAIELINIIKIMDGIETDNYDYIQRFITIRDGLDLKNVDKFGSLTDDNYYTGPHDIRLKLSVSDGDYFIARVDIVKSSLISEIEYIEFHVPVSHICEFSVFIDGEFDTAVERAYEYELNYIKGERKKVIRNQLLKG